MAFQIRRGLDADRIGIVFEDGEPIYAKDTKKLYMGDGVTPGGILVNSTILRSIVVPSPEPGDNIPLVAFARECEILSIREVVDGTGSPSVTWNLNWHPSRNHASPTKAFSVDRTTSSESGDSVSVFDNSTINANDWVWLTVSAKTGTLVKNLTLVIEILEK